MSSRSIKPCEGCGEEREIAAHGLCFKCYRREEREQKELWVKPDRHATQLRKAQRTTRNAWMKIWNALDEIVEANLVPESTCEQIREILRPEIANIAGSLKAPVNSEHKTISEPFTVPDALAPPVISDPSKAPQVRLSASFSRHEGVTSPIPIAHRAQDF
jgi:hypothetical protein